MTLDKETLMSSVLSIALSREVAHQELWKEQDIKRFGYDKLNRTELINTIKEYMNEHGIRFNYIVYLEIR